MRFKLLLAILIIFCIGCSTAPKTIQSGSQKISVTETKQNTDTRDFSDWTDKQLQNELEAYAKAIFEFNLIPVDNGSYILEWNLHQQSGQIAFTTEATYNSRLIYVLYGIIFVFVIIVGFLVFRKN